MNLKKWNKPVLNTIGIEMTESGGADKTKVDHTWTTYPDGNPEDHYTYS